MTYPFFLYAIFFASFDNGNLASGDLLLRIDNIEQAEGMIWIGVYDSQDNFLNQEKAVKVQGERVERTGSLTMRLKDVPFGTYAVAVLHDVNNSGQMDQNFMGVPQEPYAFSGVPKSRFRAPRFEEISFDFRKNEQGLVTGLAPWW